MQSKFLATKAAAFPLVAEEGGTKEENDGGRRCCSTLFAGIINVTRHMSARWRNRGTSAAGATRERMAAVPGGMAADKADLRREVRREREREENGGRRMEEEEADTR